MTKYIISSGTSVICELLEDEQLTTIKITNDVSKAISFDTIGEAMLNASKVNNTIGSHQYRTMPLEVNKK